MILAYVQLHRPNGRCFIDELEQHHRAGDNASFTGAGAYVFASAERKSYGGRRCAFSPYRF